MNKFNQLPINWNEISKEEFTRIFFCYVKDPIEFRQMFYDQEGNRLNQCITANLFSIAGTKRTFGDDGLGTVIFRDGDSCRFAKFGNDSDWSKFESDFAAQFRGDNS